MSNSSFTLVQDIFCPVLHKESSKTSWTALDGVIGIAPVYGSGCNLSIIAFASSTNVLVVRLPKRLNERERNRLEQILLPAWPIKVTFHMDVLATSLHLDLGLRLAGGVDLLALSLADRESLQGLMDSMGGESGLNKAKVKALFHGEENSRKTTVEQLALRAWVAWRAANKITARVPRIDTSIFSEPRLAVLANLVRDARRRSALKPTAVHNEISDDHSYDSKGRLHVTCTRFKTRIRKDTQRIDIRRYEDGSKASGKVSSINGRAARINVNGPLPTTGGRLMITTVGKEPLTNAEMKRVDIVLNVLQRTSKIVDKPFFQAIWLPNETPSWPPGLKGPSFSREIPISFPRSLNGSQSAAVAAILSPQYVTLIQGPPGTGKTTVIAAAVTSIQASSSRREGSVYLVAQSNVAVKNIAEKLASVRFLDFKLIVSKDFHYDWHEHLYEKVNPNLIRSDQLSGDIVGVERQLLGSKTVIVDEASQVEIGDFVPMISSFSSSLRKLVFVGDDKQLAPHGRGQIESLKSVFEMKHLRDGVVFLDTQYRLVLNSESESQVGANDLCQHAHSTGAQCCHFINVPKSKETKQGTSWINEAEVSAAIGEARKCETKGRSYRIITPYDAQRGKLEAALKAAKLPWQDKVFCVDSFQGNEDDYIILSIVRTTKVGFLRDQRRVNVMLTRCKKLMKICTNRAFVEGKAKDTLVGLLAKSIDENVHEHVLQVPLSDTTSRRAMPVPPQLTTWLDENYASPRVDPEWLDACYDWVTTEHHLDPALHMPAIIEHVDAQLLQSDLCDSMSHGTGIPLPILTATSGLLRGPVLVEITAITEVGASALTLDQIRITREERLAAGADAGDDENEADLEIDGEGPVPNYPRSMLRFELSDGATTLPAMEYRPMPELTLGVTPLGYKMVLKNVFVRRGIAFLEPACVTFKGYQTEDREALQQADFARGLRCRLGRPEPEPQVAQAIMAQPAPNPPAEIRSPLREISPPPSPTLPVDSHHHSDDEDQPRRRRVPAPMSTASSSTLVTSSYFSSSNAGPAPRRGNIGIVLSPTRAGPIEIDSDSENEPVPKAPPGLERPIIGLKSTRRTTPFAPSHPTNDPPSDDYGDMEMDDAFLEELQKAEAQSITPAVPRTGQDTSGRQFTDPEVITIDDDEEMEDKENLPMPQRHVRRRVLGERKAPGEVIDISDSD
ncbi:hypothetical protein GGX14DRAFT_629307 [Mycena pura]|uniref:AAA+ ATPase domain-containing protein n=1 Tax=Mycena pura TaxID=153505 RepID=A0AAD6YRQ3_9AGAR|nr:hypothetical protein GGX14DRAFT_629307 [Mycena pura]